jgi:hypothetical protein
MNRKERERYVMMQKWEYCLLCRHDNVFSPCRPS